MKRYEMSDSVEMERRTAAAKRFFGAVMDSEEQPYFVSDEACLYDVYAGDDAELIERCHASFGYRLNGDDFRKPVWRLLDEVFGETATDTGTDP